MAETRFLRMPARDWGDAVTRARAARGAVQDAAAGEAQAGVDRTGGATGGPGDALTAALVEHLDAPIRATFVATAGGTGSVTRLTMVADRVMLVTEAIAEHESGTRVAPEVQVAFVHAADLWPAVAGTLPPLEALRAPASAAGPTSAWSGREPVARGEDVEAFVAREQANLQVGVEAWRGGDSPAVVWARLWSVVDGRLLDVRTKDGEVRLVERPAGSVAAELRWALVGAVDATTPATAGGPAEEGER